MFEILRKIVPTEIFVSNIVYKLLQGLRKLHDFKFYHGNINLFNIVYYNDGK